MARVTKTSNPVLGGAYGPELAHVWKSDNDTWVGYALQNPINGSPEAAFRILDGSYSRDGATEKLMKADRDTNFFESPCGRLSAEYTRQGEDAIIWKITYK
jgi:hypothetical protein